MENISLPSGLEHKSHYQIGAPALIYREKIDEQTAFLQVPGHRYPRHKPKRVAELEQRRNRLAARWYYSSAGEIAVRKRRMKKRSRNSSGKAENVPCKEMDLDFGVAVDRKLQQNRAALFSHFRTRNTYTPREILRTYATYDRPYASVNLVKNQLRKNAREPKLETNQRDMTRTLRLQRLAYADPAYLAPFGFDALGEESVRDPLKGYETVDRSKTECFAPRPWQGNCLLCLPCPCPNCVVDPSWVLVHPKGLLLDTLCVSNLIPPNAKENAGHLLSASAWHEKDQRIRALAAAKRFFPNTLYLHDTIMDIQQSGVWDTQHPDCTLVVRTATHISIVRASVSKPDLSLQESRSVKNDLDDGLCWGNYVLSEKTRLDLRSLLHGTPSYRPVSLACHPKYGNDFTAARFAFVSYSEHSGDQNVIHHFTLDSPEHKPSPHPIPSLRYISSIDFTSTHPMCLWCAASSYVRPPLVTEINYANQYPLGLGTALYSVDLRSNTSIFQWSPSAEEMKPEGVFSISGILTDWDRDHTVWVASKSAGKTWEVDCRMPYQAVNSWSLSTICDDDRVSFPQSGPHGDPFLLAKVREYSNGMRTDPSMILNLDTAPGCFGFQIFQRPLHKPRFQTDSLECVSVPDLESLNKFPSIATSAMFALPEKSDDTFSCGIAGFRTRLRNFVTIDESASEPFHRQDASVLCTVSMTNKGDIYCHSLLESSRKVPQCQSFPGLPDCTAGIPLPKEMDGRTRRLANKRWKPTGGMNLKLFWSNQYPSLRDSLLYFKPTATRRIRIPTIKMENHPSYKAGKNEEPFEIPVPEDHGIRILAPPGSQLVNTERKPLVIPKSWAERSMKKSPKFRNTDTANLKLGPPREDDETEEQPRTDLTPALIDKVINTWDLWDDLDDDSSTDVGTI